MSEPAIVLPTAPQFDFDRTVSSHGWLMLAPCHWHEVESTLHYVYQTAAGDVLRLRISADDASLRVDLPDRPALTPALRRELTGAVERMLNLDWDLSAFYAAMREQAGYDWLERERQGRILISASLWEDLAKVLLTTNCSWSNTVAWSERLCQLGAAHPTIEGCHAFPSAERVAGLPFDELAASVRAGYRNAYLHELAGRIAAGELELEAWRRLDGDEFFAAVKSLKGFGDYAAGTLARMYGHFDRIAIDTAAHAMYAARHNGGLKGSVKDIKARYARFGEWRGLVMWMDVMRGYSSVESKRR